METTPIRVGTLVRAKKDSGICSAGERGLVYEVYRLGGRPGYGVLFEGGGYDGFSPEEAGLFLTVTDTVIPTLASYEFRNVTQLRRDYEAGHFAEAFPPYHRANGHGRGR